MPDRRAAERYDQNKDEIYAAKHEGDVRGFAPLALVAFLLRLPRQGDKGEEEEEVAKEPYEPDDPHLCRGNGARGRGQGVRG